MSEATERLARRVQASLGKIDCDLVLSGGRVVNLFDGGIVETDLAIHEGVVVGLGGYRGKERLDLKGAFVCPSFIEGHIHVESSLLSPPELARAVCPRGTAAVVADPHEIANVMGVAGVRALLAAGKGLPVDFFYMAPSCVPASPLESAGASLSASELAELAKDPAVLGLAEMMNFPGLLAGDPTVLAKLAAFQGLPMDGHAPLLGGQGLNAYLAAGPQSDHECTNKEEAAEKLAKGMWLMIREGTSAKNLSALAGLVNPLTERRCMLVSDDRHPDDLAQEGHLDAMAARAVEMGFSPITVLRMLSLNPAERFGLKRRGAIAPGWTADLAVVEDLKKFRVLKVFKNGSLVAEDGQCLAAMKGDFPEAARHTMRLDEIRPSDLEIEPQGPKVRVIGLVPGQILTEHLVEETPVGAGRLAAEPGRDLARLVVINRHGRGGAGFGMVRGFSFLRGAIAGSVAHDSHNLLVAGVESVSMAAAANRVRELGGGLVVAWGREILGELPLPLAGLMSDKDLAGVLEDLAGLRAAASKVCRHPEPFMALSFLALPVIPSLKLTDRGLVDVALFDFVDLFLD